MPNGARTDLTPWSLSGSYLEGCNCEPMCPCRSIGGRPGGRSTHGVCAGALSWVIGDGRAGEVDLSGLAVVLAYRYDDDEPGSPWTFTLYVDDRGDERQREALARIFTGELGGTPEEQFPWAWKESKLVGWRPAAIEIDHSRHRGWFRIEDRVELRVRGPVADQDATTCVVPGHHRPGTELHTERVVVDDEAASLAVRERCGFESTFEYASRPPE